MTIAVGSEESPHSIDQRVALVADHTVCDSLKGLLHETGGVGSQYLVDVRCRRQWPARVRWANGDDLPWRRSMYMGRSDYPFDAANFRERPSPKMRTPFLWLCSSTK